LREAPINKGFSAARGADRGVAYALEKGRVGEGIAGGTHGACGPAADPLPNPPPFREREHDAERYFGAAGAAGALAGASVQVL
jgi:hypothetical protein